MDVNFETMKQQVYIGSDHAGVAYKAAIKKKLISLGHEVEDFGTHTIDSVDYPDFAHPVAERVVAADESLGILICGSGNGVNMTANKHSGVRSALCWTQEIAALARQHNNANVLALPARFITEQEALSIVEVFLGTEFEGGRHQRRVEKI